jgi:hypothetical protein
MVSIGGEVVGKAMKGSKSGGRRKTTGRTDIKPGSSDCPERLAVLR